LGEQLNWRLKEGVADGITELSVKNFSKPSVIKSAKNPGYAYALDP
jgi:hypothetical protein